VSGARPGAPPPAGPGGRRTAAVALAIYALLALAVTWPWVTDPGGVTFGVTYGDLGSHIGTPAAWAREWQVPWLPGTLEGVNAPEGHPMDWVLNLAAAPSLTLLTLLAGLVGGVAANGLWVVAGFALTAWSMFLFTRALVGRADAAFVAGLAFGFWPYSYATVSQPLGHGWVLVLLVWRMTVLLQRPTARNGIWAGLAAALAVTWVQYWLLIAGVLWATLAAAGLVWAWRRGRLRAAGRAQAVAAAPVLAVAAVLALAASSTGFAGVPERPAEDQTRYSARAAMYLVPGPDHPLAGRWTEDWIVRRFGSASSEALYNPIYVGLATLLLAALGAGVLVRRRSAATGSRAPVLAVAAAGAVALVMSAPPRVELLGVRIPTPAALLVEVTTAFRTSARFAHVVMLALCVLAAVGAAALLGRRRPRTAAAVTAVLAAALFVDLWARSPLGSPQRVEVPAAVRALGGLPRGTVATYPLLPAPAALSTPVYHATFHGRPIFNGYVQGSAAESRKLGLAHLTAPWVPGELRAHGVRYVMVAISPAAPPVEGLPPNGAPVPGLRHVASDRQGSLYEVVAPPARAHVWALEGLSFVEGSGESAYRHMTSATARLELTADCARCRRVLELGAASVGGPRRVTARDARGRVLAEVAVPPEGTRLRVPVTVPRRTVVALTVDPPPAVLDPADGRRMSVTLSARMRLVPAGAGD